MEWQVLLPACLLAGALAGLFAGLLGVGGGIVIVPVLAYLYAAAGFPGDAVMQFALATSLASILFTGLSSVRAHHHAGAVRWPLVRVLAVPLMAGSLAGAFVADALGSERLMQLFGVFAVLLGLRMLLARTSAADDPDAPDPHIPPARNMAVGGLIGVASAIFGIGGGSLTVPYLHACGMRMQKAVATSSACGVPIALAGTLGYVLAGSARSDLPAATAGYVHLPGLAALVVASVPMAVLGAKLAHRLPAAALRRIFAVLLLAVGIDFLV